MIKFYQLYFLYGSHIIDINTLCKFASKIDFGSLSSKLGAQRLPQSRQLPRIYLNNMLKARIPTNRPPPPNFPIAHL